MKRETARITNRINPSSLQELSGRARSALVPFAILAVWATSGAYPGLAQQSTQQTFQSATEASQSLFQAVQSNNGEAVANIMGGSTELTSSRDEAQDKLECQMFVQKYQEMNRLHREPDGSVTLYIGAENWPFPVPIVAKNGTWRFDPDAGMKEVLFRRIGKNELTAIEICHELIAAEKQSHARASAADQADSPLASLVSRASSESTGGDPVLIHGYYFRVLPARLKSRTGQGPSGNKAAGSAFIAYPAEYRSSGVMSFIVTENGVVYEKDLGPNTPALASAMAAFHKDGAWHACSE